MSHRISGSTIPGGAEHAMPNIRVRQRWIGFPTFGGGTHTVYNLDGTVFSTTNQPALSSTDTEKSYDVDHGRNRPPSAGDDFALARTEWLNYSCSGPGLYRDGLREYKGDFHPNVDDISGVAWPAWSNSWTQTQSPSLMGYTYLDNLGPSAWNRFKPGQPVVNLGQFIAEARDLPLLFKIRLKEFKDLGSDYLNFEFGWRPFLSDLRKLATAQRKVQQALLQLKRDNGEPIRRFGTMIGDKSPGKDGMVIPIETVEKVASWQDYQAMKPILTTLYYQDVPKYKVVRTHTNLVWFSGRFRYWIPDVGTDEWNDRAVKALYGLNPTPSLLWEVLPFSWLVDWFSNIGDVLSNISENAAESLVADYAYLMQTRIQTRSFSATANISIVPNHSEYAKVSCELSHQITRKYRRKATPFGFSISEASLTARQWAILAALGISFS